MRLPVLIAVRVMMRRELLALKASIDVFELRSHWPVPLPLCRVNRIIDGIINDRMQSKIWQLSNEQVYSMDCLVLQYT
jgi:hypothetical protein